MLGLDGMHHVSVKKAGVKSPVLSVTVAAPFVGENVKEALRVGYNAVSQVYFLFRGLSFMKNNEAFKRVILDLEMYYWCYYL